MSELQTFMEEVDYLDVTPLIEQLVLYKAFVSEEQAKTLYDLVSGILPEAKDQYDANFNFTEEINEQIKAIRAMRGAVIEPSGKVVQGASVREIKEVVTASSTLLQTLLKTHEQVQSFERQRAIETAVIKLVRGLSEEAQAEFFKTLEEELGLIA